MKYISILNLIFLKRQQIIIKLNSIKDQSIYPQNTATNDDFVLDFIQNIKGDLLIQLLCTSPFISVKEIVSFVDEIKSKNLDTLISVNKLNVFMMENL